MTVSNINREGQRVEVKSWFPWAGGLARGAERPRMRGLDVKDFFSSLPRKWTTPAAVERLLKNFLHVWSLTRAPCQPSESGRRGRRKKRRKKQKRREENESIALYALPRSRFSGGVKCFCCLVSVVRHPYSSPWNGHQQLKISTSRTDSAILYNWWGLFIQYDDIILLVREIIYE